MTAKISDLGVARVFNLTPLQVSRMTGTPGTPAYMPPEVMIANPEYDTNIDTFSYGIMMIHMFSGRWPEPQVGQIRNEPDKMIPISEAERRDVFLKTIGRDHPLMDTILKCINNDPKCRISAKNILKHMLHFKEQFSASFPNRIDNLKKIQTQEEEISILRKELDQKNLETNHLQQLTRNSNSQNQLEKAEREAKIKELKTHVSQAGNRITALQQEKKQSEQHLTSKRKQLEKDLSLERDTCTMLKKEINDLLPKIGDLEHQISLLKDNIRACDHAILGKDATIESKEMAIDAKTRALTEKDVILSEMSEQLTRAIICLTDKQQVCKLTDSLSLSLNYRVSFNLGGGV